MNGNLVSLDASWTNGAVTLNTGATAVSTYTNYSPGNIPAIAYMTRGSAKLVGFNNYPGNEYITINAMGIAVLWCMDRSLTGFSPGTWLDSSNYHRNLTTFNGVVGLTNSVQFDGYPGAIAQSDISTIRWYNGFTIDTWVNFHKFSPSSISSFLFFSNVQPYSDIFYLGKSTGDHTYFYISLTNSSIYFGSSTPLTTNKWYKLTITHDGINTCKMYVNGQLSDTFNFTFNGFNQTIASINVGNQYSNEIMEISTMKLTSEVFDDVKILNDYNIEGSIYSTNIGSFTFSSVNHVLLIIKFFRLCYRVLKILL
jgi:hypothetical protein